MKTTDNKTVGFIHNGNLNIDKRMRANHCIFEQGFDREDSGSTPLTTSHQAIGKDLKGYKTYGNTIQNGTPTWTNPIEYESVGDLVTDSSDTNYGKYKIPILINNTPINIYLNEPLRRVSDGVTEHIDYIDFENQKVVRNCIEVVVTGYEDNWERMSGGLFRFKIAVEQLGPGAQATFPDQFCNYAECKVVSVSGGEIGASVYYSPTLNGTFFRIRPDTQYSSVTNFTNRLKQMYNDGNPIKIVFFISTPVEESIQLPDIPLNKGTNIIDVDTTITPSNMYIKYKGK